MIGLAQLTTAAAGGEAETWSPVLGPVGVLDLGTDPDTVAGIEGLRVFYGYAGWAPDQLEGEVEEGAWFVVDAEPGDVLSPDPDELWRVVLRRQPGRLALFANFPADPSLN